MSSRTNTAAVQTKENRLCGKCQQTFFLQPGAFGTHVLWCVQDRGARFWEKVQKRGPAECWPWLGAVTTHGYGNAALRRGKNIGAHKFAYVLTKGPVPVGLQILHACDNRICCNPAHLSVGTKKDNAADRVARNKISWDHKGTKLTAVSARTIKDAHGKSSSGQLAKQFGISQSYVFHIWGGRSWKSA